MTVGPTELPAATRLAIDRTRLAHERTLLAWVRTAASLISFGFTIHKFFQFARDGKPGPEGALGPREFALLMIGMGIGALVIAAVSHRQNLQELRAEYGTGSVPYSLATIVAGLMAVVGVLGLTTVFLRQ
jgi:putative membrane protein